MKLATGDSVIDVPLRKQAKVFITSAYEDPDPITIFRKYTGLDKYKVHSVIDNPEEADIILFVENSHFQSDYYFKQLTSHPLVKKYPEKTFMYNPHDIPWAILRGLYANFPKHRFDDKYLAAAPYFETVNQFIYCDFTKPPQYLYSFYGAPSSKIRKEIFGMEHHPRAKIVYSMQHLFFDSSVKPQDPQVRYAELIRDSKFVLAPRGIGTSSIRLFEILKSGRVPVVLSDQFVFPKGPDWSKIAVVVKEKDLTSLPAILEREEASWPERSAAAKKAWDDYFAPEAVFHYFVESLLELSQYDYRMSTSLKIKNIIPFCRYAFRKTVIEKVSPVLKPVMNKVKGTMAQEDFSKYKKFA